jgi:hypothetical protein
MGSLDRVGDLWKTKFKRKKEKRTKGSWLKPSQERQKGKAKERPKDEQPARIKKKKKANPSHGWKLSYSQPFKSEADNGCVR